MPIDDQNIINLLESAHFEVQDRFDIEPRPAELRPVPASLHPPVLAELVRKYPQGLYRHQSEAIETAIQGDDVVLATATASGKSLVFMTVAANLISLGPETRVLVLYPAKALIQDQLAKWRTIVSIHLLGLARRLGDASRGQADGRALLFCARAFRACGAAR